MTMTKWKHFNSGICGGCSKHLNLDNKATCFMCFTPLSIKGKKTPKALYIFEYDNGDNIQCEWLVGMDNLSDSGELKTAYEHLKRIHDYDTLKEAKQYNTIENIYRVDDDMINAVYESRKGFKNIKKK